MYLPLLNLGRLLLLQSIDYGKMMECASASLIMKGHAALPLLMRTHGLGALSSPVRSLSVQRPPCYKGAQAMWKGPVQGIWPAIQSLNHIQGASLVAQMVTNLPAMQ